MRELVNSDDVIVTVVQSVKQDWLARINRMEAHYQRAGVRGAYDSGREAGKLLLEFGGYATGAVGATAGAASITAKGVRFASKQVEKFGVRGTLNGKPIVFDGQFYSVDGLKFSKSYYDRLWSQGRPAPFIQAKVVLGSNPKITPDPRGAPGYFKYEGAGLEMIYNPTTGQVGHIQPIKIK